MVSRMQEPHPNTRQDRTRTKDVDILSILILHYNILLDSLHYTKSSLEILVENFRWHVHHFQCLAAENCACGTENLLLKTQVSKDLYSDVQLII